MGQCPKCGEATTSDHSFCLNCGAELSAPQAEASEAAPPGGQSAPTTPPTGTREDAEATAAAAAAAAAAASSGSTTRGAPDGGSKPSAPPRRGREAARKGRSRRGATDAALPALVALVVSLGLQQAINSVVAPDSYLHRLFRPQGGWLMSVVPALIFFVFAWTITDLIMKYRVARVNEGDLKRNDVNQIPAMVRQEPAGTVLQRMRSWDVSLQLRPVGRRLTWLLQHLDTVEAQRAHEMIRHQSDLEADTAASSYRAASLFIWAMPILGFIGTVLGISLAVGGFSDFLSTNVSIDEIDRVTAELGNVASGLSFAFDTTLLGLLGGLTASVVRTAVQAKEERFLTGLEELGLRTMESATPHEGTSVPTGAFPAGAEFDEMMRTRLEELSTQMQQFTRAVRSGLDGFLTEWGKLPPEVEGVASDLGTLREQLSSAAKSTDKMILETRLLLEGLNEASTSMGNRLTSSIGSITQTVDGLGESLGGVSETLERSLTGLTQRVQASEQHLNAGLDNLKDTIQGQQRDDEGTRNALERLSSTISQLGTTLDEFRETQNAMMPLLSQLSGPLELRLMPTPMASPQQG